jgi:hypothetical protein
MARIAGCLLALLVAACGTRVEQVALTSPSPSAAPTVAPTTTPTPTPTATPAPSPTPEPLVPCGTIGTAKAPDDIEVVLALDASTYAVGEPIEMTIRATNVSAEVYEHDYGYPMASFGIARRGETQLVWNTSWQRGVPAVGLHERYAPGETKREDEVWDNRVCLSEEETRRRNDGESFTAGVLPPGRYEAHATWRSHRWAAAPVGFEITP